MVASGLLLVGAPGLLRRHGQAVTAECWLRVCVMSLLAGTVILQAGLAVLALPTLLMTVGLHGAAEVCARFLDGPIPMGGPPGWTAVTAAAALPVAVLTRARRGQRQAKKMVIEPWVGRHSRADGRHLVIMPIDEPLACSVEGPPRQIVLSDGLIRRLPEAELAAVVHHEEAHLRGGHQRILSLAAAIDVIPSARQSTNALRAALERSADEQVAGRDPRRRETLRRALVRVADMHVRPVVTGLSSKDGMKERLDALSRPSRPVSPTRRAAMHLPTLVLSVPIILTVTHMASTLGPACLGATGCIR